MCKMMGCIIQRAFCMHVHICMCVTVTVNGEIHGFVCMLVFFLQFIKQLNNHKKKKNHISSTKRGNINIILNICGLANLWRFMYKHKVQYTLGLCVLWYTVTNILTQSTTTRGVRQRVEGERVRQREQGNIEGERSW